MRGNRKILHIVASLADAHGGPTEAVLGMVGALRTEGIDARILSSNDDAGDSLKVPTSEWMEYRGVPVCFLPRVESKSHSLVGFTYTPGMSAWLDRNSSEFSFFHVHTVFSHPATVAMRHARQRRIPYAVRPLGQLCRWSMTQRYLVKRLHLSLIGRRNINGAAFLHATSKMEAEESMELGFKCAVRIVPHGLNVPPMTTWDALLHRKALGLPSAPRLLLFLSRIHEKKGLDLLIHACAQVPSNDFHLVIAGDGDASYVKGLKELATSLNFASRCHWLGFLHGEAKWAALAACDVFALPSQSENFGIAALEAAGAGLGLILSSEVGLARDLEEQGLARVVPRSVRDLSVAIQEEMARHFESGGREQRRLAVSSHYSWKASATSLMECYQEFSGLASPGIRS